MADQVMLTSKIPDFKANLEQTSRDNLLAATMIWHGGIQKELTGTRSGRSYIVPGTKREYTASAPGEAPARRLGDLARSYRYLVKQDEGQVGSGLPHSWTLEKGTKPGVAARPHVMPAYNKNEAAIKAALSRNWGD